MKTFIPIGAFVCASAATLPAQTHYSQVVSNDHPALYWNFDETSGNAKEIIPVNLPTNINDLVPVANVTRVSHASQGDGLNLGNAASFQIGDYFMVSALAGPTNSISPPWALEFWMQAQGSLDFQRNNYLMNFGTGGGNIPAVLYDYVGGAQPRYGLELFRVGVGRTGLGPLVTNTDWHHVVFVYYGNSTNGVADRADIYLDGTNAAQNVRATFASTVSLTRFIVGTSAPQFAAQDGFEGNIDEVAVYNLGAATNETDVTTRVSAIASNHFARAFTVQSYAAGVLADNPLLYWNFDEADGNAHQLAPLQLPVVQNDLTPNGGASRLDHAASQSGLGLGRAANIPVGGYFNIGQITYLTNSLAAPWLIEFWIQALGSQDTQRNDYLANFGNNAPAILYDYVGGAQPRDGLEMFRGGRTGLGPVLADANWHHVLVAYYGDGATGVADRLDMYVDGTNAAQNIRATFSSALTLGSLVVGTSGPQFATADGFEGNLDEFAIYDLTAVTSESDVTTMAADLAARHFAAAQQAIIAATKNGNQLKLSWPAAVTGFDLEGTASLITPNWQPVTITPTLNNGRYEVNVTLSGDQQFFRLKK